MKDLFGQAIYDYHFNNAPENLITETNISEKDEMDVSYLFRDFENMPKIEQKAITMSYGKVLDIGAGAGSHSLLLQNNFKLDVKAIDISKKAIATCNARGIEQTEVQNLLDCEEKETYDTILLLMNGTGIFGTLNEAPKYLNKLKKLLNKKGQILIDSSDIIYMFDEDEDGGKWIPGKGYYGELRFKISYKNETEDEFPWLYLDFNTLQNIANANGFNCQLIEEGEHYDYLAQLTIA
ncbi:SAM-dependent methyltransferase [Flavobacterium sp. LM5]|jgi:ubiquinone/menaquinone biosynthesis C-methylase UbiE|uniref:class I SAM-dependent methyltransferase n=1 Tax=Flavobacterium sp. LM5 TaxID=1938610 RepID=UPI00099409D1|nr:class I SAM-dependent methyltransferase [Flavobacterium sp. LM5]OOV26994.1 SAM-dependent methyltransferase [Flavobacterium sp. LM5]